MALPISSAADVPAIATNLGVFAAAVTAAVIGAITTWNKIKKSLVEDAKAPSADLRVLQATITETVTLRELTSSNRQVSERLAQVCDRLEELTETMKANRTVVGGVAEETNRLRIVMTDIREALRGLGR